MVTPLELICPRCNWSGNWNQTISDQCADGCCTRFLCPSCEFEGIENTPEYNNYISKLEEEEL